MNKKLKITLFSMVGIALLYTLGNFIVIEKKIEYRKNFNVTITQYLFPNIFLQFIPTLNMGGSSGVYEVVITTKSSHSVKFKTSRRHGIGIYEDRVTISEIQTFIHIDENGIIEVNQDKDGL